jgi:hypothetical protein
LRYQVVQNIMKRRFIGTLIIFLYTNTLFSQIKAIVVYSISNEQIPYATIWVENENNSAMNNEKGAFLLKNISGEKILVVSAAGYLTKKITSTLAVDTLLLNPHSIQLNETTE